MKNRNDSTGSSDINETETAHIHKESAVTSDKDTQTSIPSNMPDSSDTKHEMKAIGQFKTEKWVDLCSPETPIILFFKPTTCQDKTMNFNSFICCSWSGGGWFLRNFGKVILGNSLEAVDDKDRNQSTRGEGKWNKAEDRKTTVLLNHTHKPQEQKETLQQLRVYLLSVVSLLNKRQIDLSLVKDYSQCFPLFSTSFLHYREIGCQQFSSNV